ncbi:hypothetical protein [Yersinia intermedia]|uniref:hypothetical protein n=1 Tax=Yersinia intermedia TaxID=631 RepID=UPI0005DB0F6A|nr:hypothetical protein [Yersinia intermedia]CNE39280.1 Uncharacterised protein [Yersinia intermedia]
MKELDSFTVERLENISNSAFYYAGAEMEEIQALARIALAAKRAEPVYQYQSGIGTDFDGGIEWVWYDCDKGFYNQYDHTRRRIVYTTPQLNSPEIPDGWKLVPIELTAEMAQAAGEAHEGESYLPYSIYRAMLAAAPEKPL